MKGLAFLRFIALAIVVAIAGLPPVAPRAGAQRVVVKRITNAGKNIAKGARKGVRKVSPAVAARREDEKNRDIQKVTRQIRDTAEKNIQPALRGRDIQAQIDKVNARILARLKTTQKKFVSIIRFLPEDYGRFDFRLPPLQPRSSADSCLNVECADSIAPELEPKMELPTDTIDTNVAP